MIRLCNVSFSYDDKSIIKNISLRLEKGKIYSVIGPNGSGKSTLLKLIGKLRTCDGGNITLDGKDYGEYSRKAFARCVASLPQSRNIPMIRSWELVSHGRFPYLDGRRVLSKEDRLIVDRSLRLAGAEEFALRSVSELSGGERQKVYLSMLYAQEAEYILLDEPTTFLDMSSKFGVMNTLTDMKEAGKCVVAVLHELSLALKYSDEIIVLSHGEIVFSGTPKELVEGNILGDVFGIKAVCVTIDGSNEYIIKEVG